jgi:hypothetical protein
MRVCAQSSQRSTWPPSAAVRQTSIAVMTRRWRGSNMPRWRRAKLAVAAEDIRHLQLRSGHRRRVRPAASASMFRSSSGLWICRIVLTATRA